MTPGSPVSTGNPGERWSAPRPLATAQPAPAMPLSNEPPPEAVSSEHLCLRAHALAERHQGAAPGHAAGLARHLEQIIQVLEAAADADLLDQTTLLENQWHAAQQSLPRDDARLPEVASGPAARLPRVYELVRDFARQGIGPIDGRRLQEFLEAYQSITPLTLAELWAIPAMLRIALLEQLQEEVLASLGQHQPGTPIPGIQPILVRFHSLSELDWKPLAESLSVVERLLRQDPAGVHALMDFESRERYRSLVAELARRSPLTEEEVARRVLRLANLAPSASPADAGPSHVGYYLLDRGRPLLEEQIGYHRPWKKRFLQAAWRAPLVTYLGTFGLLWLTLVAGAAALLWLGGVPLGLWGRLGMLLLFAGASSELAVRLVNWLVAASVPPRPVLRLDFSHGIPEVHRTAVVVPTLLSQPSGVRRLAEQLEMRYLANRDDNLLYVLLTDFADASEEACADDQPLLDQARAEIERLNDRYARGRATVFYLLHRPRHYNPEEGVWMGEERKRGKLAALNHLLLSGESNAFLLTVGNLARLRTARYVLTLDTDTLLPRDAASKLVGFLAHPLNRPKLDPDTRLVVSGYGVLQPRVATTLPEARRSRYSRLFAGDAGLDPYTSQASDVYQDLFGRGSFIGKGIYDVQAFEGSLADRFPPNRVLSHDLIEGAFAGNGLAGDVLLFEGFPATLLADMSRRHRWIRGDWQIAAWLGRTVPSARGRVRNSLEGLARWKIFDNLRRSLMPVFLLALLLLGWTLAPSWAWGWTALALLLYFGPLLPNALAGLARKPAGTPWRLHLKHQAVAIIKAVARELVALCILPYTVHCHLDAISRTLYRLYVSRRHLLEWTTSSDAEIRAQGDCRDHYEVMWACPLVAQAAAAALAVVEPWALVPASPLLMAWLLGPLLAWHLSKPAGKVPSPSTASQRQQLRRWARHTWHFFDIHANAERHGLPPDSVRDDGGWVADHRTSTTNIGMGLLAHLAAHDLGYLPLGTFLTRTERALNALGQMERYRGHFYNWYDLRTLEPLEPRYVSTVDSGNLWAALLVLRAGLEELADQPPVSPRLRDGIRDTVATIASLRAADPSGVTSTSVDQHVARLRRLCIDRSQAGTYGLPRFVSRVQRAAETLLATVPSSDATLEEWCQTLLRMCHDARHEHERLAFWHQFLALEAPFHPTITAWASQFQAIHTRLERLDACSLRQLPDAADEICDCVAELLRALEQANGDQVLQVFRQQLRALASAAESSGRAARHELERIQALRAQCDALAEMDFGFLYHPQRRLLSIGYNVTARRRDTSYYDLLASEARLTSFLAVASGQLPPEHWSALGRPMTLVEGRAALLSWSGSMFEYLMPMLFLPVHGTTILEASCHAAVRHQIRHAQRHGIPWGISESCFHSDAGGGYRAFGVPGLALERGQERHRVIAPYASALAVMVAPDEAAANLAMLERSGHLRRYGFLDAIDYTPLRCRPNGDPQPCPVVMAHHSGMTLLALAHVLTGQPMQRRFLADLGCRAHDLLLQERLPQGVRPMAPLARRGAGGDTATAEGASEQRE